MADSEIRGQSKQRARRKLADTLLIFDPAQTVPETVLNAILEEWLLPCLVVNYFAGGPARFIVKPEVKGE
ncbi:MAG TPA: hypothetical protein VHV29_21115 [Terriglobales bacterium]|jgi:hypothetical protein|nr:hypothetical protein [Terriglobales bacterium]